MLGCQIHRLIHTANHDNNRFSLYYYLIKSLLFKITGNEMCVKPVDLQMFGLNLNKHEQFSATWSCGSR